MQPQNVNFMALITEQNKKNERPRIIKAYRTVKEYYPWRVLAIPAVFPVVGFFLFTKSAAEFSKDFRFGGVFYLIFALIFVGIGILFAYPSKSDFLSCKRLRENIEIAQNRGACYQGTILGYKMSIGSVIPSGRGGVPEVTLNYVLEVEFLEDTKYKTIETLAMKYHPNAVLKGNRCKVYSYDGAYYIGDFELRESMSDKSAEIPQKGMAGGEM